MLGELDDDAWRAPSRCDGWSVQDVIAHLVGVNDFWRGSVLAGLAGKPTQVLAKFDPAATPPLLIGPMRSLTPSEVLEQFVASNDRLVGTFADLDDDGWRTLAESPPGHVPVRLLAQHALWDSWVHERDIALPLGLPVPVEADEVTSCLRYAAALSPALAVSAGNSDLGTFAVDAVGPDSSFTVEVGDFVAVCDRTDAEAPCLRGDAVDLAEALSLRAPFPRSAPPEWRQLLVGLATAFDTDLDFA